MRDEPRKLTRSEAKFMADWFHNMVDCPDHDGYVGLFYVPEEAMKIYQKKYSKERKWD